MKPRSSGSGQIAVLVGLVVIAGAVWLLRPLFSSSARSPQPEIKAAATPVAPPRESVYDTLRSGETLAELMGDHGFEPPEIHQIVEVIRDFKRPRTFRPGAAFEFSSLIGQATDRIRLQFNADTLLFMSAIDSMTWSARIEVVPVTVDTLKLAGLIESSLWFAELSGEVHRLSEGEFEEFVYDLADVFAWKVDFTRDIWKGDAFRVVMQREVRPDGSIRARRFLAIELRNREQTMSAIPYVRDERREYFDTEGEALRGVFLRYPVPYRITSGFTHRRYHPILKRNRPHRGIDYGAPHGTKVQATAAGTVTKAQYSPSYGNYVEVRHTGGIRTRYAHLSRISVRLGAKVDQGQTVGLVGATGLAKGSHLHYEFIQNGRHRNPFRVQLPSVPALEEAHMAKFEGVRDHALEMLDDVELPIPAERRVAATQ